MTILAPKTDTARVDALVEQITSREMSLADFQRDFEWGPSAVRSLIATILMGWPAGSLLFLDGDRTELATRSFVGGPELNGESENTIVLDGQQRLTSLLHALCPNGRGSYSIPLKAFLNSSVDDIEEGLALSPKGENADWMDRQHIDDLWIPLEKLQTKRSFFQWRDSILANVADENLSFQLSQAYRDHLHWLHDYEFPTVTLDSSVENAAVARIFERVNRSGLRLGSFDLVVARTFTDEWNLRNLWADARAEFPLLDHFLEDDGLPVLQTIALREEQNVRQAAVLDLDPKMVSDRWDQSLRAVNSSLRFLAECCGVVRPEWLPYKAFILVLSALALDHPFKDLKSMLRKYVISRSLSLRFDVAANTRVVEDYRLLKEVIAGKNLPSVERVEDKDLFEATKQRRSSLWRSFMCILALNEPEDPLGGEMRIDSLPLGKKIGLDQPEAKAIPLVARSSEGWHLRALAAVLVSPESATSIRRMARLGTSFEASRFIDSSLASQLLPPSAGLAELCDRPEDLMKVRLEALDQWLAEKGIFAQ